ncbi:MAG: 7-carboxy-7-deazaguanine synthase QueE [Dehalococcoidia bacterium]|nr:7-carboxy-7-deazaguanine synthase QueE [Dehalococcoidia bacterium]
MVAGEVESGPYSLLVSGDRVFFSIQGEGQSLGKPAVFLRLHLCNLHCDWCDSRFTWDRSLGLSDDEPERWSVEQAWAMVGQYPARILVITGGEPLLQAQGIDRLLNLIPVDWQVEIETNGTIAPTERMIERGVQFNVSPKLANSGNEKARRYRPEVLVHFSRLPGATFKFVVSAGTDLNEVGEIVAGCGLADGSVIVMPEGKTQRDIARHGRAAAALCREKGWRLLPRLQVMLWGQRRGT